MLKISIKIKQSFNLATGGLNSNVDNGELLQTNSPFQIPLNMNCVHKQCKTEYF